MGTEDDLADTIVPRLMAAGADLDRVPIISAVKLADGKGQRSFSLATDLTKLEEMIRKIGDVLLVVIDPLNSYFGRGADTYRTSEVRTVLEPMAEMAARMGVTIIGNSHLGKDAKSRSANLRILDSQAITAVARGISIITPDPDNPERRLFMRSKSSNAADGLPALAYTIRSRVVSVDDNIVDVYGTYPEWGTRSVAITADEAFARIEKRGRATPAQDGAKAFLLEFLAGGAKPSTDAQKAAQAQCISTGTLRLAREELGIICKKIALDGGWTWELPPARPPLPH
jgi:putative DNA primase/helicase